MGFNNGFDTPGGGDSTAAAAAAHASTHQSGSTDPLYLEHISSSVNGWSLPRDIGSDTQVLAVNGSEVGWAAAGASTDISCFVYQTSSQTLANNVLSHLTLSVAEYDTSNFFNPSANGNLLLTIPEDGKYLVCANVRFAFDADGDRDIRIRKNGSTYLSILAQKATSGQSMSVATTTQRLLSADDTLEFLMVHSAGGNLDTVGTDTSNFVFIHKIN